MIYINYAETIKDSMSEDILKMPRFLRNIIYKIRRVLGVLYIRTYDEKILITISSLNKNTLKSLEKYIKTRCVKRVCLSNELTSNIDFFNFINGQELEIFDGSWLFDYINLKLIKYIAELKKEDLKSQEITIMINKINDNIVDLIKELSDKIKLLNVVTNRENILRKVEEELRAEKGIALNINNNYKKSLLKSDIIINFDFSEEEFNKYTLPKKSCILTKDKKVKILSKSFEGVYIIDYDISFPRKYLRYLINFKDFNNVILYESFIKKRTVRKNIIKEIEEDGLNVLTLIGQNGKIKRAEINNLSKNKNIS